MPARPSRLLYDLQFLESRDHRMASSKASSVSRSRCTPELSPLVFRVRFQAHCKPHDYISYRSDVFFVLLEHGLDPSKLGKFGKVYHPLSCSRQCMQRCMNAQTHETKTVRWLHLCMWCSLPWPSPCSGG